MHRRPMVDYRRRRRRRRHRIENSVVRKGKLILRTREFSENDQTNWTDGKWCRDDFKKHHLFAPGWSGLLVEAFTEATRQIKSIYSDVQNPLQKLKITVGTQAD